MQIKTPMTIAIIIIIISALTLTYILFSLDREHEREMNRISQEMNELHEKIDRALGRP